MAVAMWTAVTGAARAANPRRPVTTHPFFGVSMWPGDGDKCHKVHKEVSALINKHFGNGQFPQIGKVIIRYFEINNGFL